jgi:hypothetical protein
LGLGLLATIDMLGLAISLAIWWSGAMGIGAGILMFLAGLIVIMMAWLTFATIHFTRVVLDDIEAETRSGTTLGSSGSGPASGAR